ncbi:MAG: 7-cyano-7-deazaguanine synthase QueC [Lentisphaerae bacterium]|nr:7-cyano-7-deazaguanine synthase QueC [Lentisphaerota bacterium]
MKPAVILLSGGLDSSTLLHYISKKLGYTVLEALTFQYGQKHARELQCAAWQAQHLQVRRHQLMDLQALGILSAEASSLTARTISVPDLADLSAEQREQPSTYVPQRNLVLLALAAAYAESLGSAVVFFGAHLQDQHGYWDCTPAFLERLNAVLALNRRLAVCLQAPFIHMSKGEIVAQGRVLGVDYAQTWSCYRGGARACGTCPACVARRQAFEQNNMLDPLDYDKPAGALGRRADGA